MKLEVVVGVYAVMTPMLKIVVVVVVVVAAVVVET